jgi:putative addiction module component (TIGR02574 family)
MSRKIGDLWDRLRARFESARVAPAQREELDRRLDAYERGEVEVVSWEEAKQRLRAS